MSLTNPFVVLNLSATAAFHRQHKHSVVGGWMDGGRPVPNQFVLFRCFTRTGDEEMVCNFANTNVDAPNEGCLLKL